MADWEEIKKLQADFHRAQLSTTAHKLSERNCIEIVQKLIASGLVEVIYTTDGKEYLTPQHLQREIKDELFVHGGRVNLVDLQQIINVDLSHIENKVAEILKHEKNLILVQGELIDNDYLDRCAEEINETLQEAGQVFLAELSKSFGFTSDFLLEVVEDRLGSIIQGQLDQLERGVLFTDAFVARQIAHIRGVFSAITRPTQLSSLVAQYGFQEKLFYSVINDLCTSGRLSGTIQGRQDKAVFVPDVYSQSQTTWIDDFFKQNGYIEYDALSRLGITDGKQFLKRRYQKEPVQFLPTCCVGQDIQDHVEAAIDEALATTGWVDIQPLIPSPFTPEDAAQLLHLCLRGAGRSSAQVFCDSTVVGDSFINSCKGAFQQLMQEKAERDAAKSPALLASLTRKDIASLGGGGGGADKKENKREERRKKAAGGSGNKGGGGRGSRETKTQKVRDKKKDRMKEEESEDHSSRKANAEEIEFMTTEEIAEVLQKNYPDCEEELVEELAQHLHRPLTRSYQDVVRTVFSSGVGDQKRKSHSEVQEKVSLLWANAKLFDKGIKLFGDDVQVQLSRHLLRTVCTDIMNLIVNLLAADHMLAVNDETTLSPENRLKIISKMPEKVKGPLINFNSSVNGKDVEEFFNQFDIISGPDYCEFMIKKLDKKRERQMTTEHRCALQEQLRHETEPAMSLHLVVVLLFQQHTGCMLHAPGRHVPPIIALLRDHMTSEDHQKLVRYQDLVVKRLTGAAIEAEKPDQEPGAENGHEEKSVSVLLEEELESIKQLVLGGKTRERETANGK